ncbi:sugar transferase [Azohydromonas caseinilytica]|uniref:Sugar transferase n=1 Tax=Azohydromonas caseinilytica TaxID=2728836 RepID=A0A848FL42_9BURK|nr:sugar transferase [Azohydromonas caseinilytica]NML18980.1 sugar transferase [Azohydromonas caseinilytica]
MKTQNGLPSSSILDFSQVATISRFGSSEGEENNTTGRRPVESDTRDAGASNVALHPAAARPRRPETLPRNDFAKQLQREKRRAERSKSPLSIVVYRLNEAVDNAAAKGDASEFLEVLHQASRETDFIGHLGDELIAVLCPDTNEQGINTYIAKVEALAGGRWFATDAATYPDQLFEGLSNGGQFRRTLQELVANDLEKTSRHGYRLKRWLDVIGASVLILLLSPLMLLVALLVAVTSRGPIIFKQMRLGTGGVPFPFYKFRSMVVNMDDSIHRQFVADLIKGEINENTQGSNTGPVYKIRSDPRVTWIGRIIRKTSIDELPQLFNVLKGDMSLVGPRPPIPYEAEIYQAWHLRRILSAKPGITGLWQVQARSTVTFNEMVRLDLRYIRECSLGLDLKILFKTVAVVLRCDGAV